MSVQLRRRGSSLRCYGPDPSASSSPSSSSSSLHPPRKLQPALPPPRPLPPASSPSPSSSSSSSALVPPPAPIRRKRRAAALHAESSIRHQLQSSQSSHSSLTPPLSSSPATSLPSSISRTSPLSLSPALSHPLPPSPPAPTPSAYITPEPRRRRRRVRPLVSPVFPSRPSTIPIIPLNLPSPPHPGSPPPAPRTRRVASRLPKSLSTPSPTVSPAPTSGLALRALSTPDFRRPHRVFHDPAVLPLVLSFLPWGEVLRLRGVSGAVQRASQARAAWQGQRVEVTSWALLSALQARTLLGLQQLTVNGLTFPETADVDGVISRLVPLTSLTGLRLVNVARLTEKGLLVVRTAFPALLELGLQNCLGLTATALVPLMTMADRGEGWKTWQLQKLDLTKYRLLSESSLVRIVTLATLQVLNLRGCRELTDAAMQHLEHLHLHELDLSFCAALTDKGVREVAQSRTLQRSLRRLSLVALGNVTDEAFRALAHLALNHLDVSQCEEVSDLGFELLMGGQCAYTLTSVAFCWCPLVSGTTLLSFAEPLPRSEVGRFNRWSAEDPQSDSEDGEEEEEDSEYCDSDLDNSNAVEAAVLAREIEKRVRRRRRKAREDYRQREDETWQSLREVDMSYCQGIDSGAKGVLVKVRREVHLIWK